MTLHEARYQRELVLEAALANNFGQARAAEVRLRNEVNQAIQNPRPTDDLVTLQAIAASTDEIDFPRGNGNGNAPARERGRA